LIVATSSSRLDATVRGLEAGALHGDHWKRVTQKQQGRRSQYKIRQSQYADADEIVTVE
jgi:hypothetical protein